MVDYAWKEGFPWASRADAQAVAVRIKRIGYIEPREVLEDGRDPSSPQHNIFEWNDEAAAEEYRLIQAGHILRSIVIVRTDTTELKKPIRAFVHVVPQDKLKPVYVDTMIALADENMRAQVLEKALKELEMWRETYENYSEFHPVFEAIDKVKSEINDDGFEKSMS
jgi:hypothetical protein